MSRSANTFIIILLFTFIVMLLPGLTGFVGDNDYWVVWACYIKVHGLGSIYSLNDPQHIPNYPPVYMYLLWLFGIVAGTVHRITSHIYFLRTFTLIFDFLGLWFVYLWTNKKTPYVVILLICILNIGYSYNTIVWGQVDGILATVMFIALYYAGRGKMTASAVWMVIALNFKLQAMFILPMWGLLFINNIISQPRWRKIVIPIITAFVAQTILLLPFITGQYRLHDMLHSVVGSLNQYSYITMNAPNFWVLALHYPVWRGADAGVWISGLTYKQAGIVLFLITSFFALLPLIILVLRRVKKQYRHAIISRELVWITSALIYILFFYFNTEMHERYCYPALIFIAAYAFYKKDFFCFALLSITIFLTLERVLCFLRLNNYNILIFKVRVLAVLFAIIIIYLAGKLYSLSKKMVVPIPDDELPT